MKEGSCIKGFEGVLGGYYRVIRLILLSKKS